MTNISILAKARKVGGSYVVTIPKEIVQLEGIRQDSLVELNLHKVKKSYKGLYQGIGKLRKEEKLDIH